MADFRAILEFQHEVLGELGVGHAFPLEKTESIDEKVHVGGVSVLVKGAMSR